MILANITSSDVHNNQKWLQSETNHEMLHSAFTTITHTSTFHKADWFQTSPNHWEVPPPYPLLPNIMQMIIQAYQPSMRRGFPLSVTPPPPPTSGVISSYWDHILEQLKEEQILYYETEIEVKHLDWNVFFLG